MKEYKIVNGIHYDQVIALIPKFDILTDEFIKHISDYWLADKSLEDPQFNSLLVNEFKKNTWFKFHFSPCITLPSEMEYENNSKSFYFLIDKKTQRLEKIKISSKKGILLEMITFKEYMLEAMDDGPSYTPLDKEANRKHFYKDVVGTTKIKDISPGISLHRETRKENGRAIAYHTLDHNKQEMVHQSLFVQKEKAKDFPYDHEVQTQAHKAKDSDLPKNYATDLAWEHHKKSKLPLRSSSNQYLQGHKMWHRLVDKALDNGHHVYHWDGKKINNTTHENKKEHLEKSFGKDSSFEHKHMIISKKELK